MFAQLSYWPRTYIQTGILAFVLAVVGMPVAILIFRRLGVMDDVDEEKLHVRPTPRAGGIVIFGAFAVAVLWPNYREHPMIGVVMGSFVCLVVGAIDDFRGGIPAIVKFFTLILVTVIMSHFGVRLKVFGWYPLDLGVTILWIVGATSAFNGLDNMDGLAGGVAAIVSGMYFVIALQAYLTVGTENQLSWFGLLSAGLIGANLGFLVYSFHPAKIFMGDAGSFFLGFTLSALGVMGEWAESRVIACTIPILILGVPLFDFAYVIVARIMKGETRTIRAVIEHCALDHLSHRLCWIGFSQRKAVLFIYLLATAMGVTGILLRNSHTVTDSIVALFQGFAIVLIVMVLMATAARRHLSVITEEANKLAELFAEGGDAKRQLEFPEVAEKKADTWHFHHH